MTSFIGTQTHRSRISLRTDQQNHEWLEEANNIISPPQLTNLALKQKIHALFESPNSGRFASLYAKFILLLTLTTIITFLVSSYPQYYNGPPVAVNVIEYICFAFFTIDYIVRIVTADVWYKWMIRPFNVMDLIVILLFYIQVIIMSTTHSIPPLSVIAIVRVIRLSRIFQVFKLGEHSAVFLILAESLRRSRDGFVMLFIFVFFGLMIFSTAMFYAEQTYETYDPTTQLWFNPDGSQSVFQSIVGSFWWGIVTITAVGYGNVWPYSPLGKIIAAFAAITSLLTIALPVSIFGLHFLEVYFEFKQSQKKLELTDSQKKIKLFALFQKIQRKHCALEARFKRLQEALQEADDLEHEIAQLMVVLNQRIEQYQAGMISLGDLELSDDE